MIVYFTELLQGHTRPYMKSLGNRTWITGIYLIKTPVINCVCQQKSLIHVALGLYKILPVHDGISSPQPNGEGREFL